jgi:hypothetical protein
METNLTHNDILYILAIVDAATQKGLFKAADLPAVSQIYEKLNSIHKTLSENHQKNTNTQSDVR